MPENEWMDGWIFLMLLVHCKRETASPTKLVPEHCLAHAQIKCISKAYKPVLCFEICKRTPDNGIVESLQDNGITHSCVSNEIVGCRSSQPYTRAREAHSQVEETCSVSQLLLHGCQVPWYVALLWNEMMGISTSNGRFTQVAWTLALSSATHRPLSFARRAVPSSASPLAVRPASLKVWLWCKVFWKATDIPNILWFFARLLLPQKAQLKEKKIKPNVCLGCAAFLYTSSKYTPSPHLDALLSVVYIFSLHEVTLGCTVPYPSR